MGEHDFELLRYGFLVNEETGESYPFDFKNIGELVIEPIDGEQNEKTEFFIPKNISGSGTITFTGIDKTAYKLFWLWHKLAFAKDRRKIKSIKRKIKKLKRNYGNKD